MVRSVAYWKLSCRICRNKPEGQLCKWHTNSGGDVVKLKANEIPRKPREISDRVKARRREVAFWDKE